VQQAMAKLERSEIISTEYKGKNYQGECVIAGQQKLSFTVKYQGRSSSDGRTYGTSAEELHNLRVMARLHLNKILDDLEETN
jgi:hypothetical protein